MSAPCSIGRQRYGVANVLSTISGTPPACAISASAARSATLPFGLPIVSTNTARVFSRSARAHALEVAAGDERRVDAHALERDGELRDGAAVQAGGRDEVIALLREAEDDDELRRQAAGRRDRAEPAFEAGELLLERRHRGVADARVDVAVRAQREQLDGVLGGVEHERRRHVERQRARAGVAVGRRARVQRARAKAEGPFVHQVCLDARRSPPPAATPSASRTARAAVLPTVPANAGSAR